ncbi:MAG: HAD family hydrolase [bacterium]
MIESIFFDLDGTLFLSTPVLHEAYCGGVEEFNRQNGGSIKPPTEEAVLNQVGNPVEEIYANLFPEVPPADLEELGRIILNNLLAEIRRENGILISGVEKTLEKLNRNFVLNLVTNAQRDYMETVIQTYNLGRFFARQRCIQDVEGSEKSTIIKDMLAHFKFSPEQVVMVGDRESDYRAAKEARTKFIGCDFGHAGEAELPPELEKIDQFSDLLDHPLLERSIGSD